jgi:antitoxin ParD1/3/4
LINSYQIAGRYASTSEVVRAGLRLLEREEEKLRLLRRAFVEGEQSGWVEDFDPEEFKARMRG